MGIILHKCSAPGWSKTFETEDEARQELLKHICEACLAGGEWDGFDENGKTTGIVHVESPPDQSDINALFGTACGCEYELER